LATADIFLPQTEGYPRAQSLELEVVRDCRLTWDVTYALRCCRWVWVVVLDTGVGA